MPRVTVLPLVLFLLASLSVDCSQPTANTGPTVAPAPSPSPALSPEESLAKAEMRLQLLADKTETIEARKAAKEYVGTQYSGWQIKGTSCQPQVNAVFFVSVDINRNKENQIVRLLVEPMFTDDGTHYWKASPLTPPLQERAMQQKLLRMTEDIEGKQDAQ